MSNGFASGEVMCVSFNGGVFFCVCGVDLGVSNQVPGSLNLKLTKMTKLHRRRAVCTRTHTHFHQISVYATVLYRLALYLYFLFIYIIFCFSLYERT